MYLCCVCLAPFLIPKQRNILISANNGITTKIEPAALEVGIQVRLSTSEVMTLYPERLDPPVRDCECGAIQVSNHPFPIAEVKGRHTGILLIFESS